MAVDPKLRVFLDMLAWSEGTSTSPITKDNGYDIIVSGVDGHNRFDDYSDHPFAAGRSPIIVRQGPPVLQSTASGRYQLLVRYWRTYKETLRLPDFGHDSQDAVALQQIKERGAISLITTGQVQQAIEACATIWASLPGNDYAQGGGKSMVDLLAKYDASEIGA